MSRTRSKPSGLTQTTVWAILDERGSPNAWLARRMGVDNSYISRIRSGEQQIPEWFVERAPLIFGLPKELLFPELTQRDDADADCDASVA